MSTTEEVIRIIEKGARSAMTDEEIIKQEIDDWMSSQERKDMIIGERYYRNKSDIMDRKRMTIGDGGAMIEATNLANNKIVHGFLRKLVDQKAGYLLSKEMSIQTKNKVYDEFLTGILNKGFKPCLRAFLKNLSKKDVHGCMSIMTRKVDSSSRSCHRWWGILWFRELIIWALHAKS